MDSESNKKFLTARRRVSQPQPQAQAQAQTQVQTQAQAETSHNPGLWQDPNTSYPSPMV